MRSHRRDKRLLAAAAAISILAILSLGCDDTELVADYFDSFFGSQSPSEQAANAAGRTGDDGVDGILDAMETVNDIQEADDLYAQAQPLVSAGDPQAGPLLDQAIALRPEDMRYRRDRARTALWQDDATIAVQQWAEQDDIASRTGVDQQTWYWEGCYRDAIQGEIDMLTYLGGDPLSYSAQQDRRAVAIYTRAADSAERLAQLNTELLNIELAARQMEMAREYREKAQKHGG